MVDDLNMPVKDGLEKSHRPGALGEFGHIGHMPGLFNTFHSLIYHYLSFFGLSSIIIYYHLLSFIILSYFIYWI